MFRQILKRLKNCVTFVNAPAFTKVEKTQGVFPGGIFNVFLYASKLSVVVLEISLCDTLHTYHVGGGVGRHDGEPRFAIGLGRPLFVSDDGTALDFTPPWPVSVLNFVSANLNPPYYSSVGDTQIPGLFVFYFGGQWSEFEAARHAIPLAAAMSCSSCLRPPSERSHAPCSSREEPIS